MDGTRAAARKVDVPEKGSGRRGGVLGLSSAKVKFAPASQELSDLGEGGRGGGGKAQRAIKKSENDILTLVPRVQLNGRRPNRRTVVKKKKQDTGKLRLWPTYQL